MPDCKIFYIARLEHASSSEPHFYYHSSVKADIEGDVDDLQKALVAEYSKKGAEVAIVYKPQIKEFTIENIAEVLALRRLDEFATFLNPHETIREVFGVPSGLKLPRTTLFVRMLIPVVAPLAPPAPPDAEASEMPDVVGQLQLSYSKFVTSVTKGPTPSNAAKSTEYNRIQGSQVAILDGRLNNNNHHETSAPPIELYHPAFGKFSARAQDTTVDVPEHILQLTAKFLRRMSGISTNETRRDADSRDILAKILGVAFERISNSDSTSSDYMSVQQTKWDKNAAPIICEIKSELGQGGSDPSVQVSFSYARFYCMEERAEIRDSSCCPAFLVGLAGPWLVIMGGVITSRVIVQRLSSYEWLGCSRVLDDQQVIRIARLLYALRNSIDDLRMYYQTLTAPSITPGHVHPRFCPSISSFHDKAGNVANFTYVAPLELDPRCVAFKAVLQDSDEIIVVKFVRRYGQEVHEWMAEREYAPRLIQFETLGPDYDDMNLVVMDYVAGNTLETLYPTGKIPPDVRSGIRIALDVLTSGGFVFGDLRRPNVMVADGPDPIERRIRFIDFDWAGREGPGLRYPFHTSSFIRDVAKASEYGLILREHQDRMLEAL